MHTIEEKKYCRIGNWTQINSLLETKNSEELVARHDDYHTLQVSHAPHENAIPMSEQYDEFHWPMSIHSNSEQSLTSLIASIQKQYPAMEWTLKCSLQEINIIIKPTYLNHEQ